MEREGKPTVGRIVRLEAGLNLRAISVNTPEHDQRVVMPLECALQPGENVSYEVDDDGQLVGLKSLSCAGCQYGGLRKRKLGGGACGVYEDSLPLPPLVIQKTPKSGCLPAPIAKLFARWLS